MSAQTDPERLRALQRHALPTSSLRSALQRIARVAQRGMQATAVVITQIGKDRISLLACEGLTTEQRRQYVDNAWDIQVVDAQDWLLVEDLSADSRFAAHPLVTGTPEFRFLGSTPVRTPEGYVVGTVSALDSKARSATETERAMIRDIGAMVEHEWTHHALPQAHTDILESITDAFFALDTDWHFTYINAKAEQLLQTSREELVGANVWDAFPDAVDLDFYTAYHEAVDTQESVHFEAYFPPLDAWFRVNAYPFEGGLAVYFDDVTARNELEETLRIREEEARLLFEESPVPMFVHDPNTFRFLDVNEAAKATYGYTRDAFLGMTIFDIRPESEVEALKDYLATERSNDLRSPPGVWSHCCADGSTIEVEVTSSAITFEGAEAVLVAINDVTERNEARKRLEEREELLSSINENITEGLYRTGANGTLEYVNDAFVQIFGYDSREQMLALPDLTVLYANEEERDRLIRATYEDGHLRSHEVKFRRADGSTFWGLISANATEDDEGRVLYHDGALLNIDARKQAEEALRRREEYLAVTLESIGDAVIATDTAGKITEMNGVAERLTGWKAEEAEGRTLSAVFQIHNAHTGEPVENPVEKVLREGRIVGLANDTVLTARDGQTRQVADSAAPIRLKEKGKLLGVVLVFRDVTEEYNRQAEIEAERTRLKLALRGGDLGFWDWSVETDEVYYSDRWCNMLGYDPDAVEPTLAAFEELLHPDDRERVFDAFQRHIEGEISFVDLEIRLRAQDGSWRWILDRAQIVARSEDGSPKRIAGTHLDITERKERERALKRANLLMEQAQSIAEMGSGVWDLESETVTFSHGAARLIGLEAGVTYPFDVFFELVHAADRHKLKTGPVTTEVGVDAYVEYQLTPRGSNEARWIRGRSRTESYDNQGNPTRVLGVLFDITAQKEATERLTHQKRLLDTVIDSLPGTFFVIDAERGQFLRWNDNFENVSGYTAKEIPELSPTDFFRDEDASAVRDTIADVLRNGQATLQADMVAASGRARPYFFSGKRTEINGRLCVVGVGIDITERKRAEQIILRREQRVEAFYKAMSLLATIKTKEELASKVCDLITDTLKYPICAIRYVQGDQLVPVVVSDRCEQLMEGERPAYTLDDNQAAVRAYREQETVRYNGTDPNGAILEPGSVKASVYLPVGEYGTISVASPMLDSINTFDIKLLEILAHNVASILERIQREEELRIARDEAEEMNRLKSAFLANMSHEIRTPLTSIIGFSEILQEESEGPRKRFADLINASSQRLMDTLKSVLDLSKLEAGAMNVVPESVRVDEEIESTVELAQPRAQSSRVTLKAHGTDAPVYAEVDKSALHRVLNNIISNAIKFTLDDGRVDVALDATDEEIIIRVQDTGVGIDEAFLPELFEPFVQESSGNTRAFEGSGLGLAITRRLVEMMQGTIAVESAKGEGTTVTVRFPRALSKQDAQDTQAA